MYLCIFVGVIPICTSRASWPVVCYHLKTNDPRDRLKFRSICGCGNERSSALVTIIYTSTIMLVLTSTRPLTGKTRQTGSDAASWRRPYRTICPGGTLGPHIAWACPAPLIRRRAAALSTRSRPVCCRRQALARRPVTSSAATHLPRSILPRRRQQPSRRRAAHRLPTSSRSGGTAHLHHRRIPPRLSTSSPCGGTAQPLHRRSYHSRSHHYKRRATPTWSSMVSRPRARPRLPRHRKRKCCPPRARPKWSSRRGGTHGWPRARSVRRGGTHGWLRAGSAVRQQRQGATSTTPSSATLTPHLPSR